MPKYLIIILVLSTLSLGCSDSTTGSGDASTEPADKSDASPGTTPTPGATNSAPSAANHPPQFLPGQVKVEPSFSSSGMLLRCSVGVIMPVKDIDGNSVHVAGVEYTEGSAKSLGSGCDTAFNVKLCSSGGDYKAGCNECLYVEPGLNSGKCLPFTVKVTISDGKESASQSFSFTGYSK